MKRVLFIALTLMAIAGVEANAEEPVYAPEKGDFSTEIQFNPFNSDYTFKLDALKLRYFIGDKDALLLEFGIEGINEKDVPDTDDDDNYTSHYRGNFHIGFGYERHFFNYKRIDLYAGAKFSYEHGFAGGSKSNSYESKKYTGYDPVDEVKNYNAIAAGIFTGLDFYVYKGLYCGIELGFYLKDKFAAGYKVKTEDTNGFSETTKYHPGGHNFNFNTKVEPLIRLGWKF
ncbi:MAG: hypothetical protein NC418_10855 [Muribaculaceae bacterium]|nr:hypothetical protein [Muribaculaceae bacterium]